MAALIQVLETSWKSQFLTRKAPWCWVCVSAEIDAQWFVSSTRFGVRVRPIVEQIHFPVLQTMK